MKELTLVRNHSTAQSVTRHSERKGIWTSMRESTLVTSSKVSQNTMISQTHVHFNLPSKGNQRVNPFNVSTEYPFNYKILLTCQCKCTWKYMMSRDLLANARVIFRRWCSWCYFTFSHSYFCFDSPFHILDLTSRGRQFDIKTFPFLVVIGGHKDAMVGKAVWASCSRLYQIKDSHIS